MSVLRIPCPNCRKELKVRDPKLLGRKAKCPACEHRFILTWESDDNEIPIESQDTAQYVTPEKRKVAGSQPLFSLPPAASAPTIDVGSQSSGVHRLQEIQRKNRKRRNTTLLAVGVFVGLLVGGYFLARPYLPSAAPPPIDDAGETLAGTPAVTPLSTAPTSPPADWAEQLSPTKGDPIELRMVPSGTRLIVNLRPAELWSDDPRMAELRASLTEDVTNWMAVELKLACGFEPQQIEEVLLTWVLGVRGSKPELTAVVHLVDEARMSDLLDEFGGAAIDEFAQPKVYMKGERATLILDTKTLAIAPQASGAELAEWVEMANYNTSDGILDLLAHTDRDRLVTIVFEPKDLPLHLDRLVGELPRPIVSRVSEWFAVDTETVAWSLHTGDEFFSELLIRGPSTVSARTLENTFKERLEAIPREMVDLVQHMRPQRSGFRKLIGRFPAMLEVSRRSTISDLEGRAVRLITVMPPKAAPNLALGTVLTWDESTRTDFSAEPAATMAAVGPKLPDTVIGRLQRLVDAEFSRVPLYEALDYIGGEIQVTVEIDGDALKDAGFTKNMAQTFTLGKVSAAETLKHLIGQYEEPGKKIVVVIDESENKLIVLTKKFADQRGLIPHDFGG